MSNLIAFGLEIAKPIPTIAVERNGVMVGAPDDFDKHRPLGITCAALHDGGNTRVFAANSDCYSLPADRWMSTHAGFMPRMTETQAKIVVGEMSEMARTQGTKFVTWNGQFDFHTLAEESGMWEECAKLAVDHHIDLMFDVFCNKGWRVSLASALSGMGLQGKAEGMDGAKAPEIWQTDPLRVIQYVERDAVAAMELARKYLSTGSMIWQSGSGRWHEVSSPFGRLRTVRECIELPPVDNSWMDVPVYRPDFFEWMGKYSPYGGQR